MQLVNRKGEFRPMVDLTGKFYLLDELDEDFVQHKVTWMNTRSGKASS